MAESDLISRQAAIDWLKNEWDGMVTSVFKGIENLPSAQLEPITVYIDHELTQEEYEKLREDMANAPIMLSPAAQPEQRWIPCSERLPEIGEKVLITKRKTAEMTEVCTARYNVTRWCATGIISNSNVIAWMPPPEPWKGEES